MPQEPMPQESTPRESTSDSMLEGITAVEVDVKLRIRSTGRRILTCLACLGLAVVPVRAQEPAPSSPPAETEEVREAGSTVTPAVDTDESAEGSQADSDDDAATGEEGDGEEEIDDSDLDEQVYREDENDFTPSEQIPADEAIPFPTNI